MYTTILYYIEAQGYRGRCSLVHLDMALCAYAYLFVYIHICIVVHGISVRHLLASWRSSSCTLGLLVGKLSTHLFARVLISKEPEGQKVFVSN